MLKNLRTDQRHRLADLIPLDQPFMIRLDPTNACNFRCQYCPTAHSDLLKEVGRSRTHLSMDLFQKIVDDLADFDRPLGKLYLYKDGEPLLNPAFADMVRYAKASGHVEQVWTTSNGSRLNPEVNQALVDAGLDLIKISIQGVTEQQYLDISKARIDYEQLRAHIADLHERGGDRLHVHVKIVDANLSDADKNKFISDFQPIASSIHIDPLMGWSQSSVRDFQLGTRSDLGPDGLPLTPREVCPFPFYTLSINSNGTVSVCCVDWAHETVVGDLRTQSLRDVWFGDALHAFRMMHLERRRAENRACGDCQYLQTLADDLDDDREAIRARLQSDRGDRASR